MANLTDYGRIYGVPHDERYGTGKSGFTPLIPTNPAIALFSPISEAMRILIEEYQRFILRGYTSQQMQDLDCITKRQLHRHDLTTPILPILHHHRWDRAPRTDMSSFTVDDNVFAMAWEAMTPSLRMASAILLELPRHAWFDAMLLAPREDIDSTRFTAEDQQTYNLSELQRRHKCFRIRPADQRRSGSEANDKMHQLINDVLMNRLKFGFMTETRHPITGELFAEDEKMLMHAITHLPEDGSIRILLSWEMIIPLIIDDAVPDSVLLIGQFYVASVIVHEFTHALHYAQKNYEGTRFMQGDETRQIEPYFDIEQESEIGRSAEQAMFGGMIFMATEMMQPHRAGIPQFVLFIDDFPQVGAGTVSFNSLPILINPDIPAPTFAHPIPVTYYEKMNEQSYWDINVRKFGVEAFQAPKALGAVYLEQDSITKKFAWSIVDAKNHKMIERMEVDEIKRVCDLTPQQRAEFSNSMKRAVRESYQSLTVLRDEKVRATIDSAELTRVPDQSSAAYLYNLGVLLKDLDELVDIHKRIVAIVPLLETEAKSKLYDIRNGIQGFYDGLCKFVHCFLPNSNPIANQRLTTLAANLDQMWQSTFLAPFVPFLDETPSAPEPETHFQSPQSLFADLMPFAGCHQLNVPQPQIPQPTQQEQLGQSAVDQEAALLDAINAFYRGDFAACKATCTDLITDLNGTDYLQAMARIQLGKIPTEMPQDRLRNLRRGLKALEELDRASVSSFLGLPIDEIWQEAIELLDPFDELVNWESLSRSMLGCVY